ncbi:hypothetical protein [Plantactinospora sp. GCM10030261]|uniref:hypothetical protein n=1 Tax=Plantactinospora sp. GCM10030261 TaxID=3273420 RepID=UPI0036073F94
MRFRRPRRPDPESADRMLDNPAGAVDADGVARLLAAAAAPGRPDELTGEGSALAAFRAARAAQRVTAAASRKRRRTLAGATLWATAGALAVTAGIAVAAGNQIIDYRSDSPNSTAPAPAPPVGSRTPGGSVSPEGTTGGSGSASPGGSTPTPGQSSGSINPSVPGLCSAYLAKDKKDRDKALRTPAFQPLTDAAGGPAEVEEFCLSIASGSPESSPPGAKPPGAKPSKESKSPKAKKEKPAGSDGNSQAEDDEDEDG